MYEDYTTSSSRERDKYINEYRTNKRMINCSERMHCMEQVSSDILDETDKRSYTMPNLYNMSLIHHIFPIDLNSSRCADIYSNSSMPGGLL